MSNTSLLVIACGQTASSRFYCLMELTSHDAFEGRASRSLHKRLNGAKAKRWAKHKTHKTDEARMPFQALKLETCLRLCDLRSMTQVPARP